MHDDGETPRAHDDDVQLVIVVARSGGVLGRTRHWLVDATGPDAVARWRPLVEACPWDSADGGPDRDRYVYRITAGDREAVLAERRIEGAWRELVDRVRAEGFEAPPDARALRGD